MTCILKIDVSLRRAMKSDPAQQHWSIHLFSIHISTNHNSKLYTPYRIFEFRVHFGSISFEGLVILFIFYQILHPNRLQGTQIHPLLIFHSNRLLGILIHTFPPSFSSFARMEFDLFNSVISVKHRCFDECGLLFLFLLSGLF